MERRKALLLAIILFLLAVGKLLLPGTPEALRSWADRLLLPGAEEAVEAMGRGLTGHEERVPVFGGWGGP